MSEKSVTAVAEAKFNHPSSQDTISDGDSADGQGPDNDSGITHEPLGVAHDPEGMPESGFNFRLAALVPGFNYIYKLRGSVASSALDSVFATRP